MQSCPVKWIRIFIQKSANFAFVEAEESIFIILVSLIKSLAVHFTCLMLFHVFSVLPVSQYFCKVFLQVLQGLLVHLIISDTYFPFLLSSTIKSFMAGGVCLLILNKNSIEQTMNDYITNELARAKWLICYERELNSLCKKCISAMLFLM